MEEIQRLGELLSSLKKARQKEKTKTWRAAKRKIPLTLAQLKEILEYNPETGIFRWKQKRNSHGGSIMPGDVAGSLRPGEEGGYIQICVGQRLYRANRLAWWFMTGEAAPTGIDVEHKDRNRANDSWDNLRLATRSQNNCNTKVSCANTSGFKGVHQINRNNPPKPWFARITINKKIIHLGCFDTAEEANEARKAAEIKYHGEFRVH